MGGLETTMRVSAADAILLASVAWALFATGLFVHRWLSKTAGHPIGLSPSIKHIP